MWLPVGAVQQHTTFTNQSTAAVCEYEYLEDGEEEKESIVLWQFVAVKDLYHYSQLKLQEKYTLN